MSTPELAPGEIRIGSEIDGTSCVILVEGELDHASAGDLERALKAAEKSDSAQIVLDLSGLTFIDSTGLALLVDAVKHSRQNADRLRVKRSEAIGVQRILEMTGVEDRIPYLD